MNKNLKRIAALSLSVLFSLCICSNADANDAAHDLTSSYKDSRTPCYEGSLDINIAAGVSGYATSHGYGYGLGLATTHGCLITPKVFIGAGLGLYTYGPKPMKHLSVPIFIDVRKYFVTKDFKPYIDVKWGYNLDNKVYLSPSVGLRLDVVDFGIGYELLYRQHSPMSSLYFKMGFRW